MTVFDQDDEDTAFFTAFGSDETKVPEAQAFVEVEFKTSLHCLSDADGKPTFTECGTGDHVIKKAMLSSDDVFVLDTRNALFVWIGSGASSTEKGLSLKYAMDYLIASGRPKELSVTRLREGRENDDFLAFFKD